jgi:Saxitoxin biosynthesis operon protein SxtJ
MLEINWNPSRRELREFATIWLPAFAALAGLVLGWRSGSWTIAFGLWAVAAASLIVGLARPALARPLFLGLTLATFPIGWIVSHVVLGVIYFGLFTLVGMLMRLVGYDPMDRAYDSDASTYWRQREARAEPGSYFRQF